MSAHASPIRQWIAPDRNTFETQIAPLGCPAWLRGVVDRWPCVRAGGAPAAIRAYYGQFDRGHPVDLAVSAPAHRGILSYDESLTGFTFERRRAPLGAVLALLERLDTLTDPPTIAVQSVLIEEALPGFAEQHPMPLLDAAVKPRLWVSNRGIVPAHFDDVENLACVVAGRRRFTLLPMEQVRNLYVGPLDHTPTGVPVSLVDFTRPDGSAHPRFNEALAHATVAELEPGDALYIPPLWWHHVQSLEPVNILVNYWWGGSIGDLEKPQTSGLDALFLALLTIKDLPVAQRQAWREIFEQYVFQAHGDPVAHLPAERQGIAGPLGAALKRHIKDRLIRHLLR
jgi:hypothetical protein